MRLQEMMPHVWRTSPGPARAAQSLTNVEKAKNMEMQGGSEESRPPMVLG